MKRSLIVRMMEIWEVGSNERYVIMYVSLHIFVLLLSPMNFYWSIDLCASLLTNLLWWSFELLIAESHLCTGNLLEYFKDTVFYHRNIWCIKWGCCTLFWDVSEITYARSFHQYEIHVPVSLYQILRSLWIKINPYNEYWIECLFVYNINGKYSTWNLLSFVDSHK